MKWRLPNFFYSIGGVLKRINFWAAPGRLESPFYSLAPLVISLDSPLGGSEAGGVSRGDFQKNGATWVAQLSPQFFYFFRRPLRSTSLFIPSEK